MLQQSVSIAAQAADVQQSRIFDTPNSSVPHTEKYLGDVVEQATQLLPALQLRLPACLPHPVSHL